MFLEFHIWKILFFKYIYYSPAFLMEKKLLILQCLWLFKIRVSTYSTGFFSVDVMGALTSLSLLGEVTGMPMKQCFKHDLQYS